MGIWARLREATRRPPGAAPGPRVAPQPAAGEQRSAAVGGAPSPRPPVGPGPLAKRLHAEFPDGVPTDVLFERAEAAGLDPQAVDRALDAVREAARVKVRRVKVGDLRVADLASLESVRTRIKGSAYWVTDKDRRRYGGSEYLLIREPENEADASAVAVYGKGRKVGHLSAARAASLAPLLDRLDADAFRVTGAGTSPNSIVLWVDVPKVGALRA